MNSFDLKSRSKRISKPSLYDRFRALLLILTFFVGSGALSAQEKMTKKEMEDAIKMMKDNGMPEEAIEMFKKTVEQIPEEGWKENTVDFSEALYGYRIPKKDAARIQSVIQKDLSVEELSNYINSIVSRLEQKIGPDDRDIVQSVLSMPEAQDGDALAGIAGSFWMMANFDSALLLMGKAVQLEPSADNICGFAAFLNMMNVPEVSIPLLNRLNKDFPDNGTILNNLGQAWFSLGDFNKATEYLDKALKINKKNSQANLTKSLILSTTSNSPQKFDFIKGSIRDGFSEDKVMLLEDWGGKLEKSDVRSDVGEIGDILNLRRYLDRLPPWPQNVEDVLILTPGWEKVLDEMESEIWKDRSKLDDLNAQRMASASKRSPESRMVNLSPKMAAVWRLHENEISKSHDPALLAKIDKYDESWRIGRIENRPPRPIPDPDDCPALIREVNENIAVWTDSGMTVFEPRKQYEFYLQNENAYKAMMQSTTDLDQEIGMVVAHKSFLGSIHIMLTNMVPRGSSFLPPPNCLRPKEKSVLVGELPDYDYENCDNKINFTMPGIGTWGIHCNKGFVDFSPMGTPFKLKFEKNLMTNKLVTFSVGVSKGPVSVSGGYNFRKEKWTVTGEYTVKAGKGPFEIGSAQSVTLEFDKGGVSDVIVGSELKGMIGGVTGGMDVKAGQMSWNSGPATVSGGGITGDLSHYVSLN